MACLDNSTHTVPIDRCSWADVRGRHGSTCPTKPINYSSHVISRRHGAQRGSRATDVHKTSRKSRRRLARVAFEKRHFAANAFAVVAGLRVALTDFPMTGRTWKVYGIRRAGKRSVRGQRRDLCRLICTNPRTTTPKVIPWKSLGG